MGGFLMLLTGAIALAAALVIGRAPAAGMAAFLMLVAYFVNGFRSSIPAFETASPISWYAWTWDHVPLAGHYDWASMGLVAVVAVALLAAGVLGVQRRDVGVTVSGSGPPLTT